jgi:hypothetical protein
MNAYIPFVFLLLLARKIVSSIYYHLGHINHITLKIKKKNLGTLHSLIEKKNIRVLAL